MFRLASFNVENLFDRARALNQDTWAEGKPILDKHAKFNTILQKATYTAADKAQIIALMKDLGIENDDTGKFVVLRQNRGRLISRHQNGTISVVAEGRNDWVGWLELRPGPVDERAIENTGRVIRDVGADILAVIEAEDRIALKEFSTQVLADVGGTPYDHIMLIDGNDQRGIDCGLLTRQDFPIDRMRSHVDDAATDGQTTFSRDCPEFEIALPSGATILLLVNHLKSKGYGGFVASNARRKLQAERVRAIYEERRAAGIEHIAVVGDFNDSLPNDPLTALRESDLRPSSSHANYDDGGYPGTYGGSTEKNTIDYILLSPALFAQMRRGGIFRKGAWPGIRPKKWEVYEEIVKPVHAASDHMAIWADIDF